MKIEESVLLSEMIQTYGELLSPKQKSMIVNYVDRDMSLGEIAENEKISRSAVLDAIKKAKQKLFKYENIIKACELKTKLRKLVSENEADLKSKITKLLEDF